MAIFEHKRTGRRMTVSGPVAEAAFKANPVWRLVPDEKPLTPKEQLQADAEALGLSTDGKADEIKARIEAHVVDLRKQGVDLDIADADTLDPVELSKAIDAKLAAAPPVPPAS